MAITLSSDRITTNLSTLDLGRLSLYNDYNKSVKVVLGANSGIGTGRTRQPLLRVKSFASPGDEWLRRNIGSDQIVGTNIATDFLMYPQLTNNAVQINLWAGGSYLVSGGTVPSAYFGGYMMGFFTWDAAGVCTQRYVAVDNVRQSAATQFQLTTVFTAGSTTASRIRFQITSNALYLRLVSHGTGAATAVSSFEYRINAFDTLQSYADFNTIVNSRDDLPFPSAMVTSTTGCGQGVYT